MMNFVDSCTMKTTQDKDDFTIFDALYKKLERRHSEEENEDNVSLLSSLFDLCEASVSSHKMVHFCLRRVLNLYKSVMSPVMFPSITELNWDCVPLQRDDCAEEEEEEKEEDSESDWDESSHWFEPQQSELRKADHSTSHASSLCVVLASSRLSVFSRGSLEVSEGSCSVCDGFSYVYTHSRPLTTNSTEE